MNTINEIADAIHANAIAHGFHPQDESIENFISNQCNNMHAEITEFWDAWRDGSQYNQCDKPIPLSCSEEELADFVIRALDVSSRLGIDIQRAIEIKHEYNKTRPYKHGKKN